MQTSFLIIGHPGHELRCYGWMRRNAPEVFVMTTGGGLSKEGRIASTEKVVLGSGARKGSLFGLFSDQEVYSAILRNKPEIFVPWTLRLAEELSSKKPEIVVGDMIEGYNPSHDLCRYLINMALELATPFRPMHNWSFPLVGKPDAAWEGKLKPTICLTLDRGQVKEKLNAADSYPELAHEVHDAIERHGPDAFAAEYFYECTDMLVGSDHLPEYPPFYERYGEKQVASGKYEHVIRYEQHMKPLVMGLRSLVGLKGALQS
jgi:hypothetical protein